MIRAVSPPLDSIREKVEAGVRLDAAECEMLWDERIDLHELGELANIVRERKNGNRGYYNINTHLNPTNVCVYRCTFCAFRADLREARGYVMSDEQIVARGAEAVAAGSTEMHIVGGLHHQKDYDWYLNVVRLLHDHFPMLHLKAWTPVEINWFCHLTKRSTRDILVEMRDAGLGSLPGGGAEIFHPEVRDKICEHKADTQEWFSIHRTAHELGLRSNATMLYGHIENAFHRTDHLLRLRALQDETGGFTAFICWSFQPDNTEMADIPPAGAFEYLKTQAVARLYLDNVANIQSSWVTQGEKTGQVALFFGANDMGSLMIEENVVSSAGTVHHLTLDSIRRCIREAGYIPRQRNVFYQFIDEDPGPNPDAPSSPAPTPSHSLPVLAAGGS